MRCPGVTEVRKEYRSSTIMNAAQQAGIAGRANQGIRCMCQSCEGGRIAAPPQHDQSVQTGFDECMRPAAIHAHSRPHPEQDAFRITR